MQECSLQIMLLGLEVVLDRHAEVSERSRSRSEGGASQIVLVEKLKKELVPDRSLVVAFGCLAR